MVTEKCGLKIWKLWEKWLQILKMTKEFDEYVKKIVKKNASKIVQRQKKSHKTRRYVKKKCVKLWR